MENIEKTLRTLMKENKMTMQSLADKSGVPFSSIKNILQGRSKDPRISTMSALAEALGCSIARLAGRENKNIERIKTPEKTKVDLFKKAITVFDDLARTNNVHYTNQPDVRDKCINQLFEFSIENAKNGALPKIDQSFAQWMIFNSSKELNGNSQLNRHLLGIKEAIDETLYFVKQATIRIAKKLSTSDVSDLNEVYKILCSKNVKNNKELGRTPYTTFDWVTPESIMPVSSFTGIMEEPKDVSFRKYVVKTKSNPNNVYIDDITTGIPSGKLIIIIAIGVTDKKGKFLGTLTTGVDISRLNDIITR